MVAIPNQLQSVADRAPAGGQPGEPAARFSLADVESCVGERFATIAHTHGGRIALCTPSESLTYGDLASAAAAIAAELNERLTTAPAPVALLLRDDAHFTAAYLATLAAGKVCVPLNPEHPADWLERIWRDSGARLLLTETACCERAGRIAGDARQILDVAQIRTASATHFTPARLVGPNQPACLIYTSGSSGTPKGVIHTHRALLHAVRKPIESWRFRATDRLSLLAARATAAEMVGIFSTLLIGAELHPYHLRQSGIAGLVRWLRDHDITVWRLSPSVLRTCLGSLPPSEVFPAMRLVRLGSEPATRRDLELFRRHFLPGCILANAYATSETALISVGFFDHDTPVAARVLPVGVTAPETDVLLLDPAGRPVAAGEAGEIVVRSRYLAEGYWGRPDLTAAAFIPDPDGGPYRCYRTGDLGRRDETGCLHHLGRRDAQIKIRGHRVDPTEIEAALLEAPAVQAAAAAAHADDSGRDRLVGYVVAKTGTRPSAARLRSFLQQRLPEHMVPSAYVILDRLPVTSGGKLDRRALPPPARDSAPTASDHVPSSHLEAQLAGIWAEVLQRSDFGTQDDFFDLGGDSLLAARMLLRVEQECGATVDPGRVLSRLTIARLATELMAGQLSSPIAAVVPVQVGTRRTPFFFLHHDFDSGGFYSRRLARALGADATVYAVQPHGVRGTAIPDSIEEMAADHLQSIRTVQPTGPYCLGGFCGGGVIAYEIARQLVTLGERVTSLLMIDANAPNVAHLHHGRLARRLAAVLGMPPRLERALFLRLKWYSAEVATMGRAGITAWLPLLWRKAWGAMRRQRRVQPPAAPGESPASIWHEYHRRMAAYVPRPLDVRIALFRSSYLDERGVTDLAAGWRVLASDVTVHPVAGNHHTCITTEVAALARHMRGYLPA